MSNTSRLARSPELMSRDDTALVVVDVQERLLPSIRSSGRLVWNIRRLLDAARLLQLPVLATEQYPRGLGSTVAPLADYLGEVPSKLAFSCGGCEGFVAALRNTPAGKVLVTGIEAHVCVQQTALDLLADGYSVYLAVDAIGARFQIDYDTALRRLESSGATLTTTEAAMFEWCAEAGTDTFKQISALVRESPPED